MLFFDLLNGILFLLLNSNKFIGIGGNFMENQKLLQEILKNTKQITTRLDVLEHIGKEHGERLQSIENIVTRIEKDHGDSIRVLFDYFVDQDKKHQKINSEINRLNENLNVHNSRIFALEFYKEKLASK